MGNNNSPTAEQNIPSTSTCTVMNTTAPQSNLQIPVRNYAIVLDQNSSTAEEQSKLFSYDIMTPD